MSSDYWTGLVRVMNAFTFTMLMGLSTASHEGAGWSSLESVTGEG